MLLVESGADPTASSKDDKIPLSCAAKAGHYAVMSYLLSKEHDSHTLMEERDVLNRLYFSFYLPLKSSYPFTFRPFTVSLPWSLWDSKLLIE